MQSGEFLGDREHPIVTLYCRECGETVFTKGTMTFENALRGSVLEIEEPDHEHPIDFERKVIGFF